LRRPIRVGTREEGMADVEIAITVKGTYEVKDGMITTTSGKSKKTTQVGGSPPEVLARIMLREMVQDHVETKK
jgi:hypothetical protein